MNDSNIQLVVLFNHKYEKNLEKLDRLYKDRFSQVSYLMPFYRGERSDVISIYEHSFRFQGYFTQGYPRFKQTDATHYVFIADDMIMHPSIHEGNILEKFGMDMGEAYFPRFQPFNQMDKHWGHAMRTLESWENTRGVEFSNEIPSVEEALERMAKHGVHFDNLEIPAQQMKWHLFEGMNVLGKTKAGLSYGLNHGLPVKSRTMKYPMVRGYADFMIIPATIMDTYMHYCGVFAAMGLFVEVAAPTALLLCEAPIIRENPSFKGWELWTPETLQQLGEACDYQVDQLFKKYPDIAHIHPIKLSKWKF